MLEFSLVFLLDNQPSFLRWPAEVVLVAYFHSRSVVMEQICLLFCHVDAKYSICSTGTVSVLLEVVDKIIINNRSYGHLEHAVSIATVFHTL